MITAPAPTIVIDTNVLLDLFVFHDPRWTDLLAAIESKEIDAITRADCRAEYLAVLHYQHLPLDDDSRLAAAARFDALLRLVDIDSKAIRLPVCTDRDDQKFMELARDAGASILISKDKALLKLGRKTAQAGLFRIMLPEVWVAMWRQARAEGTLE
jgi:putative PIN family toxin of toxin-antitoxin system